LLPVASGSTGLRGESCEAAPGIAHIVVNNPLRDLDKQIRIVQIWEQYYLQLWLNQFALTHSYMARSVLCGELRENLTRDVADFMAMQNMRRHWQRFGSLYPATFQTFVNEILKKVEPPKAAAQVKPA
jgi:hypothetical protein